MSVGLTPDVILLGSSPSGTAMCNVVPCAMLPLLWHMLIGALYEFVLYKLMVALDKLALAYYIPSLRVKLNMKSFS